MTLKSRRRASGGVRDTGRVITSKMIFVDMFSLVGDKEVAVCIHVVRTTWSLAPPSDKMKEAHQAIHLKLRARTEEREREREREREVETCSAHKVIAASQWK